MLHSSSTGLDERGPFRGYTLLVRQGSVNSTVGIRFLGMTAYGPIPVPGLISALSSFELIATWIAL